MICPNCHAEVNDSQAFCGNCGTPLTQSQPAATPSDDASTASASTTPYASNYQQPVEVVAEPIPNSAGQQAQSNPQPPYGSAQQPVYGASYDNQQSTQNQYYGNQAGYPPQGGYNYTQPTQQPASNTPFGLAIAALVCSILGLFPVGIVLAIVALVMNSNQKKSGIVTTKQTPTFVMSIISIVLSALLALMVFLFSAAVIASVESGEFNELVTNPSTTTQNSNDTSTSSSSSAAAATSSNSGTSSSAAAATTGTLSSGSSSAASAYIGTWEIDSVISEQGTQELTADVLEFMNDSGMAIELVIDEDGTFTLGIMDEVESGTWSMLSDGSLGLTVDGETLPVTIDSNGKLVMTDGNDSILFHLK